MLTTEQAIAYHDSGAWKKLTAYQRASWQLGQDCLCMPFDVFHKAMKDALGRPVWTHEFGLNREGLKAELENRAPRPTFDDVMNLIPTEKLIILEVPAATGEAP